MKIVLALICIALFATSGYLFSEVRRLSEALEKAQRNLSEQRTALAEGNRGKMLAETKDQATKEKELLQELRKIQAKDKHEGAKHSSTPGQFGYYAYLAQEGALKLRHLQRLSGRVDIFGGDLVTTESPEVIFKDNIVHLVLYDRAFATRALPTIVVRIVAKAKDEEVWVVRNRGYDVQLSPRAENRDILDLANVFPPGRYAIEMHGQFYAFSVEGPVNHPEHCVERKSSPGLTSHHYAVCPSGTP